MINVVAWDTDGDGIPELVLGARVQQPSKETASGTFRG